MKFMKQKRESDRVVILTSEAEGARVRKFRIRHWLISLAVVVLCILAGAAIGYVIYENRTWDMANERIGQYQRDMEALEQEKESLQKEMEALEQEKSSLDRQLRFLGSTYIQVRESEGELREQLEKLSLPTLMPLTGSPSLELISQGDIICIFTASPGSLVVASGKGEVTEITEDEEYGNRLVIDHGNGYRTVYRNQGTAVVMPGDTVSQGSALFLVGEENTRLGYQMEKDGKLADPMELLEISG